MNKKKLYSALYKLTSKDELRPVMGCIFHQDGHIVATDGHILAEVQYPDYTQELEGKAVNINGYNDDKKFPNYKSVIPDLSTMTELRDDFVYNNLLKAARNVILTDYDRINNRIIIEVNGIPITKTLIIKAYKIINALGERLTIYIPKKKFQGIVFKTEHLTCLVMPKDLDDREKNIESHYYTISEALAFEKPDYKKWYEQP